MSDTITQVVFNVPQTLLNTLIPATCGRFGYQATINGVANPVSPVEFAKQQIINTCIQWVKDYQSQQILQNAQAAAAAASAEVDALVSSNPVS